MLCLFHVLMVDIFIIFRVQHFFRVQIRTNFGQSVIFITFRGPQVQVNKLILNLNKKGGY